MSRFVNANIMGLETEKVSKETTLLELSKSYQHLFKNQILLAKVDNELQELNKTLVEDCKVEFLDITDSNAFRTLQRSIVFVMIYAAKDVLGRKARIVVEHSINKNYYCEILEDNVQITDELLNKIEKKMTETIEADIPIEKMSLPLEESIRYAKEFALNDKVDILKYRRTSNVNFYKIDWFYDYFYGQMVPSTGYIKNFKLHKSGEGFMLQFPSIENPHELAELKPLQKISQIFQESNKWARILGVDTVGSLNNVISHDGLGNIIRISEALQEKKIANIADMIYEQKKTLVLVAGPSSSGKTTFAERLCIQLKVNGLKPHIISIDDYYVNRENVPLDEFGKPDFECIEAIDVQQVNEDMIKLLNGERVQIPKFNFSLGKREYRGRYLQIGKGDVLILEGIHGLNEKLTEIIPKKDKFKIFISALTQLNIDDHNRIPTTDSRLIRRIVRDNRFRGFTAKTTIDMWPSVLRGESANIFPYQEEADAFFNSALVYEMCVLKQFAEPLLFNIEKEESEYTEARRLIKFLDSFLGVSSEQIPPNSILREFIGGSCFNT